MNEEEFGQATPLAKKRGQQGNKAQSFARELDDEVPF
jgi:hypothetical protein